MFGVIFKVVWRPPEAETVNSQLPENQAACQAETSFPLTGELCADFTALSDGRVEPQPERRSYVYND